MSSNVLLWQRRLTAYWVTLAILLLVGSGGDLFLGRHISTARPSSRLSNTTEIWVLLWKATKLSRGWSVCWYREMPKVLGLFKLEKGRKTEGNILLFITDKEHGDILLSVVFSKRRRDNGQKLKYKKFHLNIRKKNILFLRVPNRLLRKSVQSLSVEAFKTLLQRSLATCSSWYNFSRAFGLGSLKRPF